MRDFAPYIVILQSHLLEGLPSAVAAPLLVASRAERFAYLSVDVEFAGSEYVLALHELATFDLRQLRRPSAISLSIGMKSSEDCFASSAASRLPRASSINPIADFRLGFPWRRREGAR